MGVTAGMLHTPARPCNARTATCTGTMLRLHLFLCAVAMDSVLAYAAAMDSVRTHSVPVAVVAEYKSNPTMRCRCSGMGWSLDQGAGGTLHHCRASECSRVSGIVEGCRGVRVRSGGVVVFLHKSNAALIIPALYLFLIRVLCQ